MGILPVLHFYQMCMLSELREYSTRIEFPKSMNRRPPMSCSMYPKEASAFIQQEQHHFVCTAEPFATRLSVLQLWKSISAFFWGGAFADIPAASKPAEISPSGRAFLIEIEPGANFRSHSKYVRKPLRVCVSLSSWSFLSLSAM